MNKIIARMKIVSLYKLFRRGFGEYKLQISILIILGFSGGLLEGIGINAVIPLFSFITGDGKRGDDFISRSIHNFFDFFHLNFSLKWLLILIVSLFIIRAIVLFISNYIKVSIAANYEERMRSKVFHETLRADWPYLLNQKLGHLETIIMTNVQFGSFLLQRISVVIMTVGGLTMYILVAVNISLTITFFTLLLGFILMVVLEPWVIKIKRIADEKEAANRYTAHHINENVLGMKTVKSMFIENEVAAKGAEYFNKLKQLVVKVSFLRILIDSLIQPIGLIFVCAIFTIYYKMPNFNLAALAAIIYLIQRIVTYVQQLQSNAQEIGEAVPYFRSLLDYADEANNHKEQDDGQNQFVFNNQLEFNNISFSYGNKKQILLDLNFAIARGEVIGLIGPSGSGKTTIVDLVLRLFNPTKGKILLDGQDIDNIKIQEWRRKVGYVSQDIFLKNDTIANNIRFYDQMIDDQMIERAAKMADIYDFVQSCPEKFNTQIGERGVLLSAGQRQRIIIARVLARQPELLVLDEATSALDNESEMQIQRVIENLKHKITVLIIAHRLSTVVNADKIIVIDRGRLIEQGLPQKLLADKNSYFYKTYNIKNDYPGSG